MQNISYDKIDLSLMLKDMVHSLKLASGEYLPKHNL